MASSSGRYRHLPRAAKPLRELLAAVERGELTAPGPMVAHLRGVLASLEELAKRRVLAWIGRESAVTTGLYRGSIPCYRSWLHSLGAKGRRRGNAVERPGSTALRPRQRAGCRSFRATLPGRYAHAVMGALRQA